MNIQTNKWIFQDDTTTTGDGNVFRTGRNDLVTVFITGTSSSRTIVFEGCDGEDTPNWYSLSAIKLPDRTIAESTTGIDEAWEIPLANFVAVRCRVSAVAGGTVRVTGRVVEVGAGMVGSKEVSLLAGTNIAGKVGIDQTTDGTTNRVVAKISQVEGENLVQLSGSILEKVDLSNQLLASLKYGQISPILNLTSWQEVQHIVRAGLASKVFQVGDQFVTKYNNVDTVLDVIGIDHDTPTDTQYTHSLTLQTHNCIGNVQYSRAGALYYAESELVAGTYSFDDGAISYTFTLNNAIPAGGQAVLTWVGDPLVPSEIKTYSSQTSTVEIEVVPVSVGADGTVLSLINSLARTKYGSNNYKESAIRQWLNSAASTFTFTPQTNYDRAPKDAPYTGAGFLKLLDPDLAAVLGNVNKTTARNTFTDGGGSDLTSEKIFLLSRSEVYAGLENSINEGTPYPYYSALAQAATSGALAGRIKYFNSSARLWWLRSPSAGTSYLARLVYSTGELDSRGAYYAFWCAPACCIV